MNEKLRQLWVCLGLSLEIGNDGLLPFSPEIAALLDINIIELHSAALEE